MSTPADTANPVILAGHCGPDSWMLKSMLGRAAPGREIEMINTLEELEAALDRAALVLVNRVLDGRFASESGLELIATIA